MKIEQSTPISSFGGLNLVLEEAVKLGLPQLLSESLPVLPKQSYYNWFDIIMSYWSIFFCGGNCAEDLSINLKSGFEDNPFIKMPSADRVLERVKSLSHPLTILETKRYKKTHHFSLLSELNSLNLKLLSLLPNFDTNNVILDYDNTIIFTEKQDATKTYKKENGYCPGVAFIGKHLVYLEGRGGNSNPASFQAETFYRMAAKLNDQNIKIDALRVDSASYSYEVFKAMEAISKRLFTKARMTWNLEKAIRQVSNWKKIQIGDKTVFRGSTTFTPFERYARGSAQKKATLKQYRVVITKEKRRDGQLDMFTGEAAKYSAVVTNDLNMSDDQVVMFYNARGACEREFDILKNDFGWNNMPFSKLEQNSVFLIIMGMCKNFYLHILAKFSKVVDFLSPHFRIKKFIFRFISIPYKWIKTGRTMRLKLFTRWKYIT